jgi:hypothetical protein
LRERLFVYCCRDEYYQKTKERILSNALKYVNKMGWSVESLSLASQELGLPATSHGLVQNVTKSFDCFSHTQSLPPHILFSFPFSLSFPNLCH